VSNVLKIVLQDKTMLQKHNRLCSSLKIPNKTVTLLYHNYTIGKVDHDGLFRETLEEWIYSYDNQSYSRLDILVAALRLIDCDAVAGT